MIFFLFVKLGKCILYIYFCMYSKFVLNGFSIYVPALSGALTEETLIFCLRVRHKLQLHER